MNKITSLTSKQKKFYETIKKYIEKNKQSPTIGELAKILKISSPRGITQYLTSLEKKGMVTRNRYERRGIYLTKNNSVETINIPVIASAGCYNISIFAQRNFGDYICVSMEILRGKPKENIVSIKAVGDSMVDAGIYEGDYVLVEATDSVQENDLVVAVIDGFAVIKKLEFANNAIILKPVSSDPSYKPIILHKDFKIFGKVMDVIRMPQKGDFDIVPVYPAY